MNEYLATGEGWTLTNDGVLTISTDNASAILWGEDEDTECNRQYTLSIIDVIYSEGVTEVATEAFADCVNLESVTFSSTIQKISKRAFWGCKKLNTINFANGLVKIEELAFENCTALHEVQLPSTLIEFEMGAFDRCENLQKVTIPSSVEVIDSTVFNNCNLKTVICEKGSKADYQWYYRNFTKFEYI